MLDSLEIVSSTSDYKLKPIPQSGIVQTASKFWADTLVNHPNTTAVTVSSGANSPEGFTNSGYYNTIILGPAYDPLSPTAQNAVLVHEFLHWKSSQGSHVKLADTLNLSGREYSYDKDDQKASDALTQWLENDCKDKKQP